MRAPIEAVTLDFFNTLVFHRDGRGRGRVLMDYLEEQGFRPTPWRHEMLYEIFASHAEAYRPAAPPSERHAYYVELACRAFDRTGIGVSRATAAEHAAALWRILGPACFRLFPDVLATLQALRAHGVPLAIVSNWQSGLRHFCVELGLSGYFEHVLASAELGVAKPDRRMFLEACERLGVPPKRTLHVGDSYAEDYVGGEAAGLQVVLIDRHGNGDAKATRAIRTLGDLPSLVT